MLKAEIAVDTMGEENLGEAPKSARRSAKASLDLSHRSCAGVSHVKLGREKGKTVTPNLEF